MLPVDPQSVIEKLTDFQAIVRDLLIASRAVSGLSRVSRSSSADTIYRIDAVIEPAMEQFFERWGREVPLILVAEGLVNESGEESARAFPRGTDEREARLRVIVDPIDGTRGIMYDKRAAWALAGVAPNRGPGTRLRDIEAAVMTELPTSKMGHADVLWAVKGLGARGHRVDLSTKARDPLPIRPSSATGIDHGFASISNFFPGTKVLASDLMERIARELVGPADVTKAAVFDDQYISTGGQFYELIVGHDRFIADLRPLFYRIQDQPQGLCCHPYDCATMLIAEEAGILLTDGLGQPLDGPMDVTTGMSWAAYANSGLRDRIAPIIAGFLREHGVH